jgi:hypothetical protein
MDVELSTVALRECRELRRIAKPAVNSVPFTNRLVGATTCCVVWVMTM